MTKNQTETSYDKKNSSWRSHVRHPCYSHCLTLIRVQSVCLNDRKRALLVSGCRGNWPWNHRLIGGQQQTSRRFYVSTETAARSVWFYETSSWFRRPLDYFEPRIPPASSTPRPTAAVSRHYRARTWRRRSRVGVAIAFYAVADCAARWRKHVKIAVEVQLNHEID